MNTKKLENGMAASHCYRWTP